VPVQLEGGFCYLVEEKTPVASFRLFEKLIAQNRAGLCISFFTEEKLRSQFGLTLPPEQIWWLAETPGERHHSPHAMGLLAKSIQRFIEEHANGTVVIVDGLERLISRNGFPATLLSFVEHLSEFVMPRQAIVLFPLSPATQDPKDLATLERSLEVLHGDDVNRGLDSDDAVDRLG
jgi:hypothetical protein